MLASFWSIWLFYIATVVCEETFKPSSLYEQLRQTSSTVLPRNFSSCVLEAWERANTNSIRRSSFQRRVHSPHFQEAEDVPVASHQRFQASDSRSKKLHITHENFEETTRLLSNDFSLNKEQVTLELVEVDLKPILPNEVESCEAQFKVSGCYPNSKYRTLNGSCNNLRHPSWGMAGSCFKRLRHPDYADGISAKRAAISGKPLPDPRRISLEIHNHCDNPTKYITHMFMAWGQFLDHDITLTPISVGPNENLDCCAESNYNLSECDPILLQRDDPFYAKFNLTCLANVRSARCSTCKLGPRQQINQVTSYIDGSHVYGNNDALSLRLRNNDETGTLSSRIFPEVGELLPQSNSENNGFCRAQNQTFTCFGTGDTRANQHPGLTALHTAFLREHNRIAYVLKKINPTWNESTLFEETRRIVAAVMQVITYKEYLPVVLGPEGMKKYSLYNPRNVQFTKYDENIPATLFNEFSTAAFRFGHSMINRYFFDSRGGNYDFSLRNMFNYPFGLYTGQLEGVVEGLTMSPSQEFDRHLVHDVTNHLYQAHGGKTGLDLASLNIKRGRDHGIPGYTLLVKFCHGFQIRAWKDLDMFFRKGLRQRFQRIYERPEDMDLFTAGLAEIPKLGAVVGPTFECIMGIQFHHLKYGDRYFFTHGGQAGSFTPAQLKEFRKVTLGKLLCDNLEIDEMQKNVFLFESSKNRMEPCNKKVGMNFEAWREKQ